MNCARLGAAVLAAVLTITSAVAQVAGAANSGYKTLEDRERVARSLTAPGRDARQKPAELVQAMNLQPGMAVADIGTGAGYMLPFLSRAVGPKGRVLAEDIQDDFLEKARAKAETDRLDNVQFVKGNEADPMLPEGSVDVALALDSYHHYDYPEKMLAGIRRGLKPGGRLVIVEYYKREKAMPNGRALEHIRLDAPDVIKEIEANGFRLESRREHIKDSQYMAIFRALK
ncbi:MAG TPA: methyltransferase domain-containing protein [Bryobacteraceae bacterium]|jgi:ubiquinone/menaquinone biosynthesis C-methylase UbiE|nr:methyltransferase domain-containing protein [Bryobacteraceae bacterium]